MLKCETCPGCESRYELAQVWLRCCLCLRCRDISKWITISRALTTCMLGKLTLITKGSGWHCNSLSSTTVTGPPFVMLPPRNTCNPENEWEHASAVKRTWKQRSDDSQAKGNCHFLLLKKKEIRRLYCPCTRQLFWCWLTCPTSLGLRVLEMSYWRMSPCSQLLK